MSICALLACCATHAQSTNETIATRAAGAPAVDGKLDDVCWREAPAVSSFTLPLTSRTPDKAIQFRVCFDDAALYFGVTCDEPDPGRIRAASKQDGDDVWKDDCVEIFLRATGNAVEYDQFIVNTVGARQSVRRRAVAQGAWEPKWEAAAQVGAKQWTAEVKIPFADIVIDKPTPGQLVELKIGREDYTGPQPVLSTWPPGSPYAGAEGYGALYLGDPNRLLNPDFAELDGQKVRAWSFSEGDEGLYRPATDDGQSMVSVTTPGRYSTMSQTVRLEPNSTYQLSADVKGDAGIYLRARTTLKPGGPSVPHTVNFSPSADWVPMDVQFATGPNGSALIIIGSTEASGRGTVLVRSLRVVPVVGYDDTGPAIPVPAAADKPTVITKLLVTDSRVVRGFVGTPFDGTEASLGWNSQVWEYPKPGAGAGVGYAYRNNDGLHVRFADAEGFDAILVRGGIRADLYTGDVSWEGRGEAEPFFEFSGKARTSRALFPQRVATDRVSFFDVSDGYMANTSFFRVRQEGPEAKVLVSWRVGESVSADAAPAQLALRFGGEDRRVVGLAPQDGVPLELEAERAVHLLSPPLEADTPLAAIGIEARLAGGAAGMPLTVAVQDPVNPRLELMGVDLALLRAGRARFVLDFPDQVVPKGTPLWLTLRSKQAAELDDLAIHLHTTDRATAIREALPYRKFLMKSFFICASEARPWMGIGKNTDLEKWYAENQWGEQVREVQDTVAHCRWLDSNDDTVRQYYEWVWQRRLDFPPFEPKIDDAPGAPEWAVVARQAWLAARGVAEWWLDNRLTPTGEFGGVVGDDSDLYQNFVDFAFFEDGGVAARLKEAAADLAELAEETTLEAGINKRTMDPLHAYEEGLNQEALMAVWNYGDPVYLERCMVAAKSTEALTTVTPKGHRHFKSQELGAQDLHMDRKTDTDGHAHPLMWHPAFEVLWYNRNPACEKLLREWADGWLEHMEPRKYATAVEVATEKVTSTTTRPLYGGYGGLGSAFCFLSWITGDERYLGPFYETFAAGSTNTSPHDLLPEFIHRYGLTTGGTEGESRTSGSPGFSSTAQGAREELRTSRGPQLSSFAHKYRAAAGGKLSELARGGVAETLVTGDKQPLIDAIKRDLAELQRFPAMYTTSEPFTDRVFLYAIRNAAIAYTGGYASRNKYNRSHAVSWSGFGTEYAALVLKASPTQFRALVYNFRDAPVTGEARFWSLDHGRYRLRLGPDADGDDEMDSASAERELEVIRGEPVPVTLPPRTVAVLELTQTEPLDDLRLRADLALCPREIRVEDGKVHGVAHNTGSKPAPCVVALVDDDGRVVKQVDLGRLGAPADLASQRVEFSLAGVPANATKWSLVLDPMGEVAEVTETNNRVPVAGESQGPSGIRARPGVRQ